MLFITVTDISNYFTEHWLEVLAVMFSIAGVWLTALEKVINWPVNIIGCAIYVYVFFTNKIYLDMGISVFYVVFSFYGWHEWLYGGKNKQAIEISYMSKRALGLIVLLCIPCIIGLGELMKHYTDNTVPFLDSTTTIMSLAGTWMMARKHIENWLVWILADSIYIAEYVIKGLYPTALLSFIFTLLAIFGYYEWKKLMKVSYV
jgi:nicotinamide mononucleotide transporter